MALRSDRAERQSKIYPTTDYLNDSAKGLELLAKLIAMPQTKPDVAQTLESLNKLIHYDFLNLCGQENLPNEAEIFGRLKKTFEELEDLTEFSALANKNVVAVGGGFSAGKSQFLNSLLEDDILPTDTTPTTSIPIYISRGATEVICALNHFNNKVLINREAVKAISHAFHKKYNVSFSHIIKILTIENPSFLYENIAFLDTPGYSKSESLIKGDNTDEKIAREHLKIADHLVWLIDASSGTLPEADVEFIHSLELEKPLFLVINKADMKLPSEVPKIVAVVRERLRQAGIACHGITAYDSLTSGGLELYGDSLKTFLQRTDRKIKHNPIKQDFARVFEIFISYNHEEMLKSKEVLRFLNQFTSRAYDGLATGDKEKLKALIVTVQLQVNKLSGVIHQFEELARKVDETVGTILEKITVVGENKAADGVIGYGTVRDENQLTKLERDPHLPGTVSKVNPLGVFIDCGLGDKIMLNIGDINKRYSQNPFNVNASCTVQVIGLNRSKKAITVVVCP